MPSRSSDRESERERAPLRAVNKQGQGYGIMASASGADEWSDVVGRESGTRHIAYTHVHTHNNINSTHSNSDNIVGEKDVSTAQNHGVWDDDAADEDLGVVSSPRAVHVTNQGDVSYIPDEPEGAWIHWPTLAAYVGPGFLMCIAYLDPGNLEADLQTGAYTGFSILWVLFLAHGIGLLLQSMASRLGVVTGHHLAEIARLRYPRPASLLLWIMAELAIIGSDIQEVLGSAIALEILFGVPLWAGCIITAVDTFTFLLMHIFGVRKLEFLFVALVAIMTTSFFINYASDPPPAMDVLRGFEPSINQRTSVTALGLLGAVIMPHNLYLHSALVLSRQIDRVSKKKVWEATKYCTIDSALALFLAFMINLAVVGTFAVQFYSADCHDALQPSACLKGNSIDADQPIFGYCDTGVGVCQEIGLAHAGDALHGALGSNAKYVWAVGLLAAGQSSTMTGTYSGQFVMEGFLQLRIAQWQRVMLTRTLALGPALLVTVLMNGNDTSMDRLSEWLNVLQSVQLPFALIPLVHFCSSATVMGEFVVSTTLTGLLWSITMGVIAINLYIVEDFVFDSSDSSNTGVFGLKMVFIGVSAVSYVGFCLYLMADDLYTLKAFLSRCFCRSEWQRLGGEEPDSGVGMVDQRSVHAIEIAGGGEEDVAEDTAPCHPTRRLSSLGTSSGVSSDFIDTSSPLARGGTGGAMVHRHSSHMNVSGSLGLEGVSMLHTQDGDEIISSNSSSGNPFQVDPRHAS